jgi:hypothetical protein
LIIVSARAPNADDSAAAVTSLRSQLLAAIPHPGLSDLADPLCQGRLLGSAGTIVMGRLACRNGSAGSADRLPERSTHKVDHLASPSRRRSLRPITFCSISLSSVRSATTLRNRVFTGFTKRLFGGHPMCRCTLFVVKTQPARPASPILQATNRVDLPSTAHFGTRKFP